MRSLTFVAAASLALTACGGPDINNVSSPDGTAGGAPASPVGVPLGQVTRAAFTGSGGAGGAGSAGLGGAGGGCAGIGGFGGTATVLEPVGAPTVAANGVTYADECHDDEVATGVMIMGNQWGEYGVSPVCTYLSSDGLLGQPRLAKQHFAGQAPAYGGGCPGKLAAPVAFGLVFSYGLEPSTQTNVVRNIGLDCGPGFWPSAPPAERAIVREPSFLKTPFEPLDPATDFQLECPAGQYITGLIGVQEPSAPTPSTLVRIGAICDVR